MSQLTRARYFHKGVMGKIAGSQLRSKKTLFNAKREKFEVKKNDDDKNK